MRKQFRLLAGLPFCGKGSDNIFDNIFDNIV